MSNEYVHHLPTVDAAAGPRRWRRYRQKVEPLRPLAELLNVPRGGIAQGRSKAGHAAGDIDQRDDACDATAANVGTANG